jgi:hypothetical protein
MEERAHRRISWDDPKEPKSFTEVAAPQKGSSMIYYYPNRPTLIPPDKAFIDRLEASGLYVAEKKFNGDNVLIETDSLNFWNRRKDRHRFQPSPEMRAELQKLPKGAVINAELMNYRTKEIKDIIIVHAVMVWKGKPLLGKTWGDSRKIIEELQYGRHVTLSGIQTTGFWELFQAADGATIEGAIFKRLNGQLVFSTTPIDDVPWMYKVRKPCKKYAF